MSKGTRSPRASPTGLPISSLASAGSESNHAEREDDEAQVRYFQT